jgi:transposase
MGRPVKLSAEDVKTGKDLVENYSTVREFRRGLMVQLMADGRYNAEEIASLFSVSRRTVFEELSRIRNPREIGQWGGYRHSTMTFEQEEKFLDKYLDSASEGTILTIPEMHVAFNEEVGRTTPKSAIYDLLARHNWRKVKPDTRHPKSDKTIQEEFKKKHSRFVWRKLK